VRSVRCVNLYPINAVQIELHSNTRELIFSLKRVSERERAKRKMRNDKLEKSEWETPLLLSKKIACLIGIGAFA
jgi:hypothetical protein